MSGPDRGKTGDPGVIDGAGSCSACLPIHGDGRVIPGLTPELGALSHLILIVLMFFGRVGGLTLIFAALSKTQTGGAKAAPGENYRWMKASGRDANGRDQEEP